MQRSVMHLLLLAFGVVANAGRGAPGAQREGALLQTWQNELDKSSGKAKDTPVTRVVNLLKEMSLTLQKEMDEDEALYKELSCWCSKNNWEKSNAIEASTAKIEELESTIESLTAKSAELTTTIKELEAQVAADKAALAEATALREKQLKEFHASELDSTQAIENLRAALEVLGKHHSGSGGGSPTELDSTVAGGAVFKSERDSWSFLSLANKGKAKDMPWSTSGSSKSLDDFMRQNNFADTPVDTEAVAQPVQRHKFLQETAAATSSEQNSQGLSDDEQFLVKRALKSASAFMQSHHREAYYPAYTARSGEIMGVLKQLKEEMEGDLSEAQKTEAERAASFADLRAAKTQQIEGGEKMAEQKEDELAKTNNDLAEAKEDLAAEKKVLGEDQKFLANLEATCADADKNFQARKQARMEEMHAVAETINILTADEARDAMSGTYNFVQVDSQSQSQNRREVADLLRRVAKKTGSPQLAVLATTVELDAFTKVKKAIDDMVGMLKKQQADEVKHNDWCKAELQENEMQTAKGEDRKADLEAKIAELASTIKSLEDGIADAKAQIANLQLELQRASEDRIKENQDFQKVVADQTVTIEVLKVALDRLAKYYDFMQTASKGKSAKQTPPVPQMEYKPSKGASGVMELIEKLIYDAKELRADSVKSESAAQAAYEQNVANTNGSVDALNRDIMTKTEAKADARKDKQLAESDLSDTEAELDGLAKYNAELHGSCDYVLNNFDARQSARAQEIEALQQAKQILSGASLN